MDNIEIEIQVQVENIKPLKEFLGKYAKKVGEAKQIDQYFTPIQRNFVRVRPVKEWLRLRDASGKHSIAYKNCYFDESGISRHRDEYETSIGDINQLEKIFTALDIKPVVTVNKKRVTYEYMDYEIALDSVEGLGDFVEIEYKASLTRLPATLSQRRGVHEKSTVSSLSPGERARVRGESAHSNPIRDINPKDITDKMIKFLQEIGVGKITQNHSGYPFQKLFPKEVIYEEF